MATISTYSQVTSQIQEEVSDESPPTLEETVSTVADLSATVANLLATVASLEGRLEENETTIIDVEYTIDAITPFWGESLGCVQKSAHSCECSEQGQVHPIIVNEDADGGTISVELYDKKFSADEIEHLKTINSVNTSESTYSIFLALDAKTRACEHTTEIDYDDVYGIKEV